MPTCVLLAIPTTLCTAVPLPTTRTPAQPILFPVQSPLLPTSALDNDVPTAMQPNAPDPDSMPTFVLPDGQLVTLRRRDGVGPYESGLGSAVPSEMPSEISVVPPVYTPPVYTPTPSEVPGSYIASSMPSSMPSYLPSPPSSPSSLPPSSIPDYTPPPASTPIPNPPVVTPSYFPPGVTPSYGITPTGGGGAYNGSSGTSPTPLPYLGGAGRVRGVGGGWRAWKVLGGLGVVAVVMCGL